MLNGRAVYAVQVDDRVKIGSTGFFRQRLSSLRKSTQSLQVLAVQWYPDSPEQATRPLRHEQEWHAESAPFRLHGEWYRPDPVLIERLTAKGIDTGLWPID